MIFCFWTCFRNLLSFSGSLFEIIVITLFSSLYTIFGIFLEFLSRKAKESKNYLIYDEINLQIKVREEMGIVFIEQCIQT